MTVKELRIGNYVWNDLQKLPVKVDIRILNQQFSADMGIGRSWQAIPLTEEILLKCGFEDVSSYNDFWLVIEDDLRIEISLKNDGRIFTSISDMGISDGIKNLHQLQNLYFALTGEELNIQL